MPRKQLSALELGKLAPLGFVFEPRATPPENPTNGQAYYDNTANEYRLYQNGAWYGLGVAAPSYETFARSGPLLVVNGKGRFTFPVAGTIVGWSASVSTPPTGSGLNLRLNRNGSSLDTGTIAAAAFNLAQRPLTQAVAAGDHVTVDITAVGSTTPGQDLSVVLAWTPS
jgi:hypothetical protein